MPMPPVKDYFLTDQNLDRLRTGVGLARNFTDYDQATFKAELLATPQLIVAPEFTVLRQGEGDLRRPFPPPEDNPITPTIFDGNVETTMRMAVAATFAHERGFTGTVNAGWHHITDAGHVEGLTDDRFVGTILLKYVFNRSWKLDPVYQ